MLRSSTLSAFLAVALAACGASRSPVPLVGGAEDVSALTGEWAGEYSSAESGRSGSISFTLRAAGDSAFGDVIMIPQALGRPLMPYRQQGVGGNQTRETTVLTIRFVRVQRGEVNGTLDPYADPQSGARLLTTFSGRLNADKIEGTYTTRLPSGETQAGRWSVQRRQG